MFSTACDRVALGRSRQVGDVGPLAAGHVDLRAREVTVKPMMRLGEHGVVELRIQQRRAACVHPLIRHRPLVPLVGAESLLRPAPGFVPDLPNLLLVCHGS